MNVARRRTSAEKVCILEASARTHLAHICAHAKLASEDVSAEVSEYFFTYTAWPSQVPF